MAGDSDYDRNAVAAAFEAGLPTATERIGQIAERLEKPEPGYDSDTILAAGGRLLTPSVEQARAVVNRLRDNPNVKAQVEQFRQTQKAFQAMLDTQPQLPKKGLALKPMAET